MGEESCEALGCAHRAWNAGSVCRITHRTGAVNLYENKIPIGVVQGIVGLKRWECVATGFANHAGTTPMDRRKDALATASRDVLAVREVVRAETGKQVGTVGFMKAQPGAINVVPGARRISRRTARSRHCKNRSHVGAHPGKIQSHR